MPKAFVEPSRKVFPSWKAKIFPFMFGKLIICVVRRFPRSSPLVPMENARHIMARSLRVSKVSLKGRFGLERYEIIDCTSLWVWSRKRMAACF